MADRIWILERDSTRQDFASFLLLKGKSYISFFKILLLFFLKKHTGICQTQVGLPCGRLPDRVLRPAGRADPAPPPIGGAVRVRRQADAQGDHQVGVHGEIGV